MQIKMAARMGDGVKAEHSRWNEPYLTLPPALSFSSSSCGWASKGGIGPECNA